MLTSVRGTHTDVTGGTRDVPTQWGAISAPAILAIREMDSYALVIKKQQQHRGWLVIFFDKTELLFF